MLPTSGLQSVNRLQQTNVLQKHKNHQTKPALVWSQRHQRETLPLLGISLLVRSCTTPYTAFCVSCRQRRSAVRGDNCWQQGSPALASSPRWTNHQMRLTCCRRRGPAISPISPRSHTSGARTKSCESGPPVATFGPSPSGCTNSNTACTPCCRCHQRAACRTRQCPSYRSRNMETPVAMALGAEALPMAAVEADWRRHRRPRLGCPLQALYCFAKAATHGVVGMFDESVMFVIAFAWLSGLPTRFGDTFCRVGLNLPTHSRCSSSSGYNTSRASASEFLQVHMRIPTVADFTRSFWNRTPTP